MSTPLEFATEDAATAEETPEAERRFSVTIFPDVNAQSLRLLRLTWQQLADHVRTPKIYASKSECPLIKLATFGDKRSGKNCLRNDANVSEIFGVEVDYDGESVSMRDAQMLLHEQSVEAILYSSPSHTEAKPRWRVLCPLTRAYAPSERARFVARLNGALGGILAPESFALSLSYYCGRVTGAPYEMAQVRGFCIDELQELDIKAIFPPKNGANRAERLHELHSDDPIIAALNERRLLLRMRPDGGADMICPFESSHTTIRTPGDCTYFPAHTGGFARAHFNCMHSHCRERPDAEFLRAIGLEEQVKQPGSAPLSNLIRSDKGIIRACDHNAKELMAAAPQFSDLHFDDFLFRARIGDRDWSDHDDRDALCWLQSAHQVPGFTLGQTRTAVMALAYARRRDSLFEFVMGLPEWDRTPRIKMAFIDAWGAPDTPLTRAASRNLFIALHARAVKPGSQVDNLWVIEGPQGTLKSASLRALGGQWHAEISAQVGTSDFLRELRGIWTAELSELDSLRGREASTIKRLLSAPSDRFVEKYERHAVAYPRRAVALATTNEAAYWQDSTGARRLIPIRAGAIRLDLIETLRLQWFAEARHAYEAGLPWWEFPDSAAGEQEDRQVIDPWEDILRAAIANVNWPQGWIASASILRDWLHLEPHQQGKASSTRLGHVMRRLGFVPHRFGKARERGWLVDTRKHGLGEVSAQVSA